MNFDRHHQAIDALIELNQLVRARLSQCRVEFTNAQWAAQHCTVRCSIGRITGKTEYIKRRAFPGSVICVENPRQRDELRRQVQVDVYTAKQIQKGTLGEKRYPIVFVDDAEYFFKGISEDAFFELMAHEGDQTFVFLG